MLNEWKPKVEMDQWIDDFRGDWPRAEMLAERVVLPCMCSEDTCQGWAAVRRNDIWGIRRHLVELLEAIHTETTGDER